MSFSQFNTFQQLTSVRVVQTSNLAGSYFNGPTNNGVDATLTVTASGQLTIDDVMVNVGDRVLLQDQTSGAQNGVYVVNNNGAGSGNAVLQRSADFQNIEQMKGGQYVPVSAGTVSKGEVFVLVETLPGALGVDPINFVTAVGGGSGGTVTFTSPSIATQVAVWTNTTGNLNNGGVLGTAAFKAASDNVLANVASVETGNVAGNLVQFTAPDGTLSDSLIPGAQVSVYQGTPGASHVPTFVGPAGQLQDSGVNISTVQLNTNIKAGISASLTVTTSAITVPLVGCLTTSVVVASPVASDTPNIPIGSVVAGIDQFVVTYASAPGANAQVSYIAFIAPQ